MRNRRGGVLRCQRHDSAPGCSLDLAVAMPDLTVTTGVDGKRQFVMASPKRADVKSAKVVPVGIDDLCDDAGVDTCVVEARVNHPGRAERVGNRRNSLRLNSCQVGSMDHGAVSENLERVPSNPPARNLEGAEGQGGSATL